MATKQWGSGWTRVALATLALPVLACLMSCGGGGSGNADGGESGHGAGSAGQVAATVRPGSKEAAPDVPTSKGGDNSIQTWGLEASGAERARVTRLVRAFLDARARADWKVACRHAAAKQRRTFERLAVGRNGIEACARGMALLARGIPARAFRREAAIGEVLSLRKGGGYAFLIYCPADGEVYARALRLEGGSWRVISVGPTKLG